MKGEKFNHKIKLLILRKLKLKIVILIVQYDDQPIAFII